MVAIAAIMVAILAAIFVLRNFTHFGSHLKKMAAKITAILKSHWSRSHSSKNP
jgi:hypothetical protein